MERVAFLIEESGERLTCLLNPESVVVERLAGVRPRSSTVGRLTGAGLADDALLYTGGGRTQISLDLLFDVSLAGSSITTDDVRQLTRPLVQLAENATDGEGYGRLPQVRLVWGKTVNEPGVVTAVAERLERFSVDGAPGRSWLRLRMLRVEDRPPAPVPPPTPEVLADAVAAAETGPPAGAPEPRLHLVIGEDGDDPGERLDQLAERFFGDAAWWRLLAAANRITDPLRLAGNRLLEVPSRLGLTAAGTKGTAP